MRSCTGRAKTRARIGGSVSFVPREEARTSVHSWVMFRCRGSTFSTTEMAFSGTPGLKM